MSSRTVRKSAPVPVAPTLADLEGALRCAVGAVAKVDAMNALAYALLEKDNPRALALSAEAQRLALLVNYPIGLAWSSCRLAGCKAAMGQHVAAFADGKQALDLFRRLGEKAGEAASLQVIGHAYFYRNQFRKALAYLEKALALYRLLGNRKAELITQDVIGTIRIYLGELDGAYELFSANLRIAKELGIALVEMVAHNKLGHIRQRQARHSEALVHYRAAFALAEKHAFPIWAADCLIQIGRVHFDLGRLRQARAHFQRSLEHAGSDGKLQTQADGWRGLGDCAIGLKDWHGAEHACSTLLKMGGTGEVNCRLYAEIGLSRLRLAQARAEEGMQHARLALRLLKEGEPPLEDRVAVQECLAAAYGAMHDAEGAARHLRQCDLLRKKIGCPAG